MLPDLSQLRDLQSTLGDNLFAFAPELLLCLAIVGVLFARLFSALDTMHRGPLAIVAVTLALLAVLDQWLNYAHGDDSFTGLLRLDAGAAWFRAFILFATLLVLILSRITGLPDRDDSGDFTAMLLGTSLGLMIMASANHLLIVFLAIEMASLPSYALAGFLKGKSRGSEAALKYVVFGAASGGVMLYGISLITARVGTGYLPDVMSVILHNGFDLSLASGLLLLAVGLGYKLSIVPFHVWLPDVFEGAPAEVGAFLSVASKAAAVALASRLLNMLPDSADVSVGLAILGAVTATFGNLMAYAQTDLKRLLGYSTIAHAGFLLAAIAAGGPAALVYLVAYLFANLGAFGTVCSLRRTAGREDVASLAGMMKASPALTVAFAICVLSLLGLPPLAGFAGKFLVFESVYTAATGSSHATLWWIVFGALLFNTALGAGYYLKLLRIAVLDDAAEEKAAPRAITLFVVLMALATLAVGLFWSPVLDSASAAIWSLR